MKYINTNFESYINESKNGNDIKQRIKYVKDNYNDLSHYDLAMSLLVDNFTDDIEDLKFIVNGVFGKENNQEIEEAYDDFY